MSHLPDKTPLTEQQARSLAHWWGGRIPANAVSLGREASAPWRPGHQGRPWPAPTRGKVLLLYIFSGRGPRDGRSAEIRKQPPLTGLADNFLLAGLEDRPVLSR